MKENNPEEEVKEKKGKKKEEMFGQIKKKNHKIKTWSE
jgi:hypothetical protein